MQVAASERWAALPLEGAADRGTSISLKTKILPTEEWWTPEHSYIPWCASYGPVDIAPLLARIASEDAGVWEDAAQVSNVVIKRAMHDRLGVRKIIFTFCDDLLKTVYRLPWWDTWGDVLRPIFEALGIRPEKVVRCLLARLPPDYTIKVHHDTGRWTTKAHRVHVPILTNAAAVVFKSGPTEDLMERVPFEPGVAVELNNRCKGSRAVRVGTVRCVCVWRWRGSSVKGWVAGGGGACSRMTGCVVRCGEVVSRVSVAQGVMAVRVYV